MVSLHCNRTETKTYGISPLFEVCVCVCKINVCGAYRQVCRYVSLREVLQARGGCQMSSITLCLILEITSVSRPGYRLAASKPGQLPSLFPQHKAHVSMPCFVWCLRLHRKHSLRTKPSPQPSSAVVSFQLLLFAILEIKKARVSHLQGTHATTKQHLQSWPFSFKQALSKWHNDTFCFFFLNLLQQLLSPLTEDVFVLPAHLPVNWDCLRPVPFVLDSLFTRSSFRVNHVFLVFHFI